MPLHDKLGAIVKHEPASKTTDPLPQSVIERFKELPGPREKQDPLELPQWVRLALVRRVVEDLSYKDAAALFNRNEKTLQKYAQSPAAAKWIEPLLDFIQDPIAMARALLAGNALNVTIDRLMFLEAAKAAGDFAMGDKIARDLQDRMGIVAKKTEGGALSVKINLGSTGFDVPVIEAEWEEAGRED